MRCPPFTNFFFFWKGDEVEVVWVDKKPFIATSDYVEASYYDKEFGPIKFKGKKKDGAPRKIYMVWTLPNPRAGATRF